MLSIILESEDDADAVGDFIEREEELVIVGGQDDPRDRRANREGQKFGAALRQDLTVLPSSFLCGDAISRTTREH